MTRRVSLPGADELFRSTAPAGEPGPAMPSAMPVVAPATPRIATSVPDPDPEPAEPDDDEARDVSPIRRRVRMPADRRPTGRERHEEKITVYCSAEELIDLERARLTLRGEHGLAADRGRIVREALAVVISDLEAKGDQSVLVRRLRGR